MRGWIIVLLGLVACRPIEPAPADLDGRADWDEQTAHWCTEGLPGDLE